MNPLAARAVRSQTGSAEASPYRPARAGPSHAGSTGRAATGTTTTAVPPGAGAARDEAAAEGAATEGVATEGVATEGAVSVPVTVPRSAKTTWLKITNFTIHTTP